MTTIERTPAAVHEYLQSGHSQADAARHFGCSERWIRKLRDQALAEQPTSELRSRTVRRRNAPPARLMHQNLHKSAPVFAGTVDDIAGESTWWRHPRTDDLLPIIPGTHRKQWEEEQIATWERSQFQKQAQSEISPSGVSEIETKEPEVPPEALPEAHAIEPVPEAPFAASPSPVPVPEVSLVRRRMPEPEQWNSLTQFGVQGIERYAGPKLGVLIFLLLLLIVVMLGKP